MAAHKHLSFYFVTPRSLISIASLYLGRLSGILTNLIFIPLYRKLLGGDDFGVLAVVFSLQALCVVADFGLSLTTSRELSDPDTSNERKLAALRQAQFACLFFYTCVFAASVSISIFLRKGINDYLLFFLVPINLLLTLLQNLLYGGLIARQKYLTANLYQFAWNSLKTAAATVSIAYVSHSVVCLIFASTFVLFLQYRHFNALCIDELGGAAKTRPVSISEIILKTKAAVTESKGVAISTILTAATIQIDKPVLTLFVPKSVISEYFIATTFCYTTISILANPIYQYFQPKISSTRILSGAHAPIVPALKMSVAFLFAVMVPSLILWQFRVEILDLWLPKSANVKYISELAAMLLPGTILGAMGFIPYSLLIRNREYGYLARLSIICCTATVVAVIFAAAVNRVDLICNIYTLYYLAISAGYWWRTFLIQEFRTTAVGSAFFLGGSGMAFLGLIRYILS
jgi:hypothetical protein